jgi:hypothetical protein
MGAMKVKDLVAKLSAFDPELPVVVSGYEGGHDDPQEPKLSIALTRNYEGGMNGKYDREYGEASLEEYRTYDWISDEEKAAAFIAVAIER